MPGIASIRMGMPWRWCSAALAATLIATGCVIRPPRYYEPASGVPRLTPAELRERVQTLLQVECPRLQGAGRPPSSVTELTLEVDQAGDVRRAAIARSSGDQRVDDIVGSLTAQLRIDDGNGTPPDRGVKSRIDVGYICATSSALATVELTP